MRKEICICEDIDSCRRSIASRTRIFILMHHRELCRTTNTARLATLALAGCEIRVRGLRGAPMTDEGIVDPERHALLLYPTAEARELTPEFAASLDKPVTLIVPDGTWGQAAKVAKREAFLKNVERVKLTPIEASQYGLRRNPKENGLATFEAIARALGMIEGPLIQKRLEELFQVMVSRTLRSRGLPLGG
ncbi:MAG: DTW domain-containing protein [Verrucomicrobia bacterium]|nr:DTW domain-containing protein [Verrucomicrobiota bacterium]MBI3871026.1 DTW domain-containing protein [Verrucomicrobiota bacterium]